MGMTYEELIAQYPVDRKQIETHKARMLSDHAYRRRELHEETGMT